MKKYPFLPALLLSLSILLSLAAPALAAQGNQGDGFTVEATAAILMEADTGEILYELDSDGPRYPAALTKIMTALLTVEAAEQREDFSLDTQVTLDGNLYAGLGAGGSAQGLRVGEVLTVRDLLYLTMISGSNEASNALAVAVSEGIPAFVELMNTRAAELGMAGTHFTNPHGYHDDDHYTTARDMALLCREALTHSDFREILSTGGGYVVPATNLSGARTLRNTNALMPNASVSGYRYQYAIGIKTGSTSKAGYCLASAAEKNHRTVIAILMGGKNWIKDDVAVPHNYFVESRRLLEYGFNSFSKKTVLDTIEPLGTVPVSLCAQQDYVTVQPAQSLTATLPNGLDPSAFQRDITLPQEALQAPIEKGQVLGTVSISYEGRDYGTVDLVAATSLERSPALYAVDRLKWVLSLLWVRLLLVAGVILLLLLAFRRAVFGATRPRRRRRKTRQPKAQNGAYRGRKR